MENGSLRPARDDKAILAWAQETGQALATFRGQAGAVKTAQFSPDGKRLVTAGSDGTARVWDVSTALKTDTTTDQKAVTLSGHVGVVNTARFSPDGKLIVTAGDDKTARVWEAATGKLVATLKGHKGAVHDAQFSPDGKYVITAGDDKTARIYIVPIDDLIELAKAHVTRSLTCEERPNICMRTSRVQRQRRDRLRRLDRTITENQAA